MCFGIAIYDRLSSIGIEIYWQINNYGTVKIRFSLHRCHPLVEMAHFFSLLAPLEKRRFCLRVVFPEGEESVQHPGMYFGGVFRLDGTEDVVPMKDKVQSIAGFGEPAIEKCQSSPVK
jgi:hypothetical protein